MFQRGMMRTVLLIIAGLGFMLLGAALFAVVLKASGLTFAPDADVGPSEFISIILSALGVMLTAVTLVIGALAIYGWVAFESRVTRASEDFLDKRFSSQDTRYLQLVEDIKEDVRLQIMTKKRDDDPDNSSGDPNLS